MWLQCHHAVRIFAWSAKEQKAEENSLLRHRRASFPYLDPTGAAGSGDLPCGFYFRRGIRMEYIKAFVIGGILCLIGQILIDKTKLTPARILVSYVVIGVVLGAVGVYKPLVDFAGAGATVPLTGFGYSLAKGVKEAISEDGLLGAFTGGLKATAGGITAAISSALPASFLFKPRDES